MKAILGKLFPFLRWFPVSADGLRGDVAAGITVALVLVPQSMAYAQLAGLPVVYGLYASFIPVIVASLWGSLSQLHTGPVAMLSLMSAAALIPFATPGTPAFIELSIMLALMVGVLRLGLGLFRLGVVVNFLSSPVIVGFTNAAALIIGLSLLSKVVGVPFPRTDFYLGDLWRVVLQLPQTHWPTVLFALGTWLIIRWTPRLSPRVPGVLLAVVVATVVSWAIGYEAKEKVPLDEVEDTSVRAMIEEYRGVRERITEDTDRLTALNQELRQTGSVTGEGAVEIRAAVEAKIRVLTYEIQELKERRDSLQIDLNARPLTGMRDGPDGFKLVPRDSGSAAAGQGEADGRSWRFGGIQGDVATFSAGGAVVGDIPKGLPKLAAPHLQWDLVVALLPAALVMALIGFMEATSISKAIAATTRQRVDTNQELVGQGLANIAGSFFGSYTVSGSFSRSAVAARTGAKTGLFAIISVLGVVLVLLFLTPYLYHLPQATLAVIVMIAVFSLIRAAPLIHAWKVEPPAALIGVITFLSTLYMAPSLADGILIGVVLTVLWYLIRTMKPRADIVARKPDGTLGGIQAHGLQPISRDFVPVRFDGSLTFINVAYFEDIILEAQADYPSARAILVVGSGINEIDASGEEKVRELAQRLGEMGVKLMFSGLKQQVLKVFERAGLVTLLGSDSFFSDKERALQALQRAYGTTPPEAGPQGPTAEGHRASAIDSKKGAPSSPARS
ncbi:MAG: SulP family inorganic anion transporter [Chromatiaceae bacterium]|jgi:MFS superfamily sulfate permease-like transporter